jgi:putative hydrolase of the HAD superfamily
MAIRAVSFDLFDTLVDLGPGVGEAIRRSTLALHEAVRAHVEITFDAFREEIRAVDRELREPRSAEGLELPTEERFARLTERIGIEDAGLPARLTEIHMGMIRGQVRVLPHHGEVLRALAGRARLGLCSNFTHAPTAHRILEEADLRAPLDAVVISVEVGIRKPRREIFEALISALSAKPEETLHVGDSLGADVAGAAALGLGTVWITRQVEDPEGALSEHGGPRPDFIVSDLRDLAAVLEP